MCCSCVVPECPLSAREWAGRRQRSETAARTPRRQEGAAAQAGRCREEGRAACWAGGSIVLAISHRWVVDGERGGSEGCANWRVRMALVAEGRVVGCVPKSLFIVSDRAAEGSWAPRLAAAATLAGHAWRLLPLLLPRPIPDSETHGRCTDAQTTPDRSPCSGAFPAMPWRRRRQWRYQPC